MAPALALCTHWCLGRGGCWDPEGRADSGVLSAHKGPVFCLGGTNASHGPAPCGGHTGFRAALRSWAVSLGMGGPVT